MPARRQGDRKFVLCNGDEGDPGAFKDRSIMEGDPHSVLEGMVIGAFAVGAHEGYIYVRDEYPLAVVNLTIALEQARKAGLLGARTSSAPASTSTSGSRAAAAPSSAASRRR